MSFIDRILPARVPLADIGCPEPRGFGRGADETQPAYLKRLCSCTGDPGSPAKVRRIARAIDNGERLPPPVLLRSGDRQWTDDGFHRVVAHGYLGRETIDATVVNNGSAEAMDAMSELLFNLEYHGASPWVALAAIAKKNAGRVVHV